MAPLTNEAVHDNEQDETFAKICRTDAILTAWIRSEHLDPRQLRAATASRPITRWTVVDHFFREDRMSELMFEHAEQEYELDDVGLNYHSTAVRLDRVPKSRLMGLLGSDSWRRYIGYISGADIRASRTVVKFRKHPPHSRGFWPHSDRDPATPKSAAVLAYFNQDWRASDGGLLQLWVRRPLEPAKRDAVYRWHDYIGRRLDFLENADSLVIEVAGENGAEFVHALLLDQIVPAYNRLVILNLQHSVCFHSVTPTFSRERSGFLQWLY